METHAHCRRYGFKTVSYTHLHKGSHDTIIPGFLTKDGEAVGPFGVMGAFMQPQGQLQVLLNTIDYHLNPQAALDAPRWQWIGGKTIEVEPEMPQEVIDGLRVRGHDIVVKGDIQTYGRGQIIWLSLIHISLRPTSQVHRAP